MTCCDPAQHGKARRACAHTSGCLALASRAFDLQRKRSRGSIHSDAAALGGLKGSRASKVPRVNMGVASLAQDYSRIVALPLTE